jgi:hypothetical protein
MITVNDVRQASSLHFRGGAATARLSEVSWAAVCAGIPQAEVQEAVIDGARGWCVGQTVRDIIWNDK